MKRATPKREVTASIEIPGRRIAGQVQPEFLRLPKPGQLCPLTGLSRSGINELILPTPRNDFKPPVRSFCLRQRGARTGIRLVDYANLRSYILANEETAQPLPRRILEKGLPA